MEDIIVELHGNQPGHEDNVEEKDSGDEIAEEDVGRVLDFMSDNYNYISITIRL